MVYSKNFTNYLIIIALGLVVGGCATTHEHQIIRSGAVRLGASDILERYIGNTLSGTTPDGAVFDVYVASQQNFLMQFQGEISTGTWRVDDSGRFCGRIGDDDEFCSHEYLSGGKIASINDDGSLAGTARILAGNPKGL
jgi:hypothetical protein